MLTVHHIVKSFSIQPILDQVSFSLVPSSRLALVGPNGCGKTTLLRILAGLDQPDSGTLSRTPSNLRLGYLPQGITVPPGAILGDCLVPGEFAGCRLQETPAALEARLAELASALAHDPFDAALSQEYDAVLVRIDLLYQDQGRIPAVLASLGLGDLPLDMPVEHLSGGQKTRLALAGVLLSDPQVLLLDEPTNNLDLEMLAWLEDWLLAFQGAVLVVSHDRTFIERVATSILELDPLTHQVRIFPGSYTAYLETKQAERQRQWQAYQDQQVEIARLRAAASRVRSDAKFRPNNKAAGDTWAPGFFANRTKETIQRAKNIEKRVERLLGEDRLEKPSTGWQVKFSFSEAPASGKEVLDLDRLSVGYGEHILLREVSAQVRLGARVAVVGANGAGKTTLLRTINGLIPPLTGHLRLGVGVRTGYMAQEQENLDPSLDAFTTLCQAAPFSQTRARAFLHRFLFSGDEVFSPVGRLSYGERARLVLACLVAQGCNLLLLDEPLNHLDIPARTAFEQALAGFDGTVITVVHDRYFIASYSTHIWQVEGDRLQTDGAFPDMNRP